MPSVEKAVMYKTGARFEVGEPVEGGSPPVMFVFRIDGHSKVEREATQEDKDKYPSEYADFLEKGKTDVEAAKQGVKDAEEHAKIHDKAVAEAKKADAEAKKKADADDADAKKQAKPPFGKGMR